MLAALLLGFSTGLRSVTPLAVLAWLGPPNLTWLQGWIGRILTTVVAAGELVSDKLPFASARTKPGPLIGRLVLGGVAGYLVTQDKPGALVGVVAAFAGTFAGYTGRQALTKGLHIPDLIVALVEDVVAVGLAVAATRVLAG